MDGMYFEDYEVGQVIRTPAATITESQIIDFAMHYDPQPFHLDKGAAAESIYGGLIASGWQIGSVAFRLVTLSNILTGTSLGSPGLDELRWLKPVRPGDTIHVDLTVEDKRPSRSKPDRGIVVIAYAVNNQDGETVMTLKALQMTRRRPAA
ncbi:MAG: MaoC family dehydratase [Alphaproteobacteria bacterium]